MYHYCWSYQITTLVKYVFLEWFYYEPMHSARLCKDSCLKFRITSVLHCKKINQQYNDNIEVNILSDQTTFRSKLCSNNITWSAECHSCFIVWEDFLHMVFGLRLSRQWLCRVISFEVSRCVDWKMFTTVPQKQWQMPTRLQSITVNNQFC
jgi:hypothetical protein